MEGKKDFFILKAKSVNKGRFYSTEPAERILSLFKSVLSSSSKVGRVKL